MHSPRRRRRDVEAAAAKVEHDGRNVDVDLHQLSRAI